MRERALSRRDKEDNLYRQLQEDSLAAYQKYSGDIWTDFNAHDPGITISDVLNYALYELAYQLELPPESYLGKGETNRWNKIGLLPPGKLFDFSPVTPSDYEKLFLQHFEEIEACQVKPGEDSLYHIFLQVKENTEKESLKEKIYRLYHRYRNLCENIGFIGFKELCREEKQQEYRVKPVNWTPVNRSAIRTPRLPEQYTSLMEHFPTCYGLQDQRKEATQLTSYLLIYDLLLAHVAEQVKGVQELLRINGMKQFPAWLAYPWQPVAKWIDREKTEQQDNPDTQQRRKQKKRYLDYLDNLYGADSKNYFNQFILPEQNRRRGEFLTKWPEVRRDRFRSYNLLDVNDHETPFTRWLNILYPPEQSTHIPVADFLSRYHLRLLDDSLFFQRYKYKLQIDLIHWDVQENRERIPVRNIHFRESDFEKLYLQIHILWHNILYESFLIYGTNPDNYRIINRWKNGYILAFLIPGQQEWIAIGQFYEKEHLIRMANLFWSFLRSIISRCRPCYLIESQNGTNHMTMVFPRFYKAFSDRQHTESVVRQILPVHLKISFLWLPVREMQPFEKIYYAWRRAWAGNQQEQIELFSNQLRTFLSRWDTGIK